jgi:cobalt-zinc-cadmium efflux system outer membrane protein
MWCEPGRSSGRFRSRGLLCGLVAGVLAATSPLAAAREGRRLTLEEALELAEQAPRARSAALEVEGVEAERRGAGEELERVLALSVPLPLGGHLALERSAAAAALAAARARARQVRIERRGGVREAFYDLVAAQHRDEVYATALGRLESLSRTLRARAAAGESSGYDRMRAEEERADLLARRLEARADLAAAQAALASRAGLPASPPLVAEGTLDPGSLPKAALESVGVAGRGDVAALAAEAERRDLLGRAAGRRAFPRPEVVLGTKTQCTLGICGSGAAVGVNVTLPLFDRRQGERAALQIEAALVRARREALVQEARAQVASALAATRALREAEAALAEAPSSERLFVVARAAYEAGEMRIFELLDAHRSALAQSLRRVDSHLAARRAELRLQQAMGIEPPSQATSGTQR